MPGDVVGVDRGTALMSTGVVRWDVALYTYDATSGFLFDFAVTIDCWSNCG